MWAAGSHQEWVDGGRQLADVSHSFGGVVIPQVHPEHELARFIEEQRVGVSVRPQAQEVPRGSPCTHRAQGRVDGSHCVQRVNERLPRDVVSMLKL